MTRVALLTILIAIACQLSSCNRRSDRPDGATVNTLVRRGDGHSFFMNGGPFSVTVQAYGETLVSKGRYGPEGTTVYPVRVRIREVRGSEYTSDYFFWKNPFGEWQLSRQ